MLKLRLHWPTLVLVVAAASGGLGWLWWACIESPEIRFLPRLRGAEWIVPPRTLSLTTHSVGELRAEFRRSFVLDSLPDRAMLTVCAFYGSRITVNGKAVEAGDLPAVAGAPPGNWKTPKRFEAAKLLRAGQNEISVDVVNWHAPPALWLVLETGPVTVRSDSSWQVAAGGGYWRAARLAAAPDQLVFVPRPPTSTLESLREVAWQGFGCLTLGAGVAGVVTYWLSRVAPQRSGGAKASPVKRRFPPSAALIVVGMILWCALYWNNGRWLPPHAGFDCSAHVNYIAYVQKHHRLPLANEGWETYQPPLYYLSSALLLGACDRSIFDDAGVALVRAFNLLGAAAQVTFLFLSLRLLFPDEPWKQFVGWIVGTFLPAQIYVFQYVSNEGWSAALASVALYLTLRVLKTPPTALAPRVALGICLGAALLTKITAVVVAAVVGLVLLGRLLAARERHVKAWLVDLGLPLVILLAVGGWHFARAWYHFGNPFIGNWDESLGFRWWQDPGYCTADYFLRFGNSLRQPFYSAANGFCDAIYSTLWGDGLCGGAADFVGRPPWNYELMAADYLFAVIPSVLVLLGAGLSIVRLVRAPSGVDFLLVGLAGTMALAMVWMVLKVPYLAQAKAFYALPASLCLATFAARGFGVVTGRLEWMRPIVLALLATWAIGAYASFWIVGPSADVERAFGSGLLTEEGVSKAFQHFERGLAMDPNNRELQQGATIAAGFLLEQQQAWPAAIARLREAVELRPDLLDLADHLAGLLLRVEPRDPSHAREAVRLAERACAQTNGQNLSFLNTLAAAYAEAGEFDKAVATATQAYHQARRAGREDVAREILTYRGRYEAHKTFDGRPAAPVPQAR